MQADGTLELFAEISVVLAGFAGLAAVLRGTHSDPGAGSHQRSLRLLVEYCLATLVYSMIPLVLRDLGIKELVVWRLSAVLFSVATGTYYYFRFTEVLTEAVREGTIRSFRLSVALNSVIIVSMVASAFRAIDVMPMTMYLVGLLWNVIAMSMGFIRLIRPMTAAPR
jgi:hypothetical protein